MFKIIIHSIASTERVQFVYNDAESTFWVVRNAEIFFDICENNSCIVIFQHLFWTDILWINKYSKWISILGRDEIRSWEYAWRLGSMMTLMSKKWESRNPLSHFVNGSSRIRFSILTVSALAVPVSAKMTFWVTYLRANFQRYLSPYSPIIIHQTELNFTNFFCDIINDIQEQKSRNREKGRIVIKKPDSVFDWTWLRRRVMRYKFKLTLCIVREIVVH